MHLVEYHYPRGLELEGRHPADAGLWQQTIQRLQVGEGLPPRDSPWGLVQVPEGGPIPPAPRPPSSVMLGIWYYRRIRSAAECARHMDLVHYGNVSVAFQLTAAWANPPSGIIPSPSAADQVLGVTHAARIIRHIPEQRTFHFRLKWKDWGDNGTGYMPYDYFDHYMVESWANYLIPDALKLFRLKTLGNGLVGWSAQDEEDHCIYAFEVHDSKLAERKAWAFVVEREGVLEIEELYVGLSIDELDMADGSQSE